MRLVFMGTPEFAVLSLSALLDAGHEVSLVVTRPDRPAGRGRFMTTPPVKTRALQRGLSVLQPEKVREPGFLDALRRARPETIVVVAYGKILPREVLDLPEKGCLNLHASLLPKFRGASPVAWAVLAGESRTGVCAMRLTEGMDEGPVYLCEETPIGPDETAGGLSERLSEIGAGLLVRTLEGLGAGTLVPRPQDHAKASYAPLLVKSDGELDWSEDAASICRRIRAMSPWPGGWTVFAEEGSEGEIWQIVRAVEAEENGEPGIVQAAGREGIVVTAGRGAVRILTAKPAGKRAMPAGALLSGRKVRPGDRFLFRPGCHRERQGTGRRPAPSPSTP
ncbi:MAG: methionyl-tRNA formyltransferase [Nitrospirae bacterium]|nr:methionyl-tRNA formyltransferase [Nitrospirota bacterium]